LGLIIGGFFARPVQLLDGSSVKGGKRIKVSNGDQSR